MSDDFETRVQELCREAIGTNDPDQLRAVLDELRAVMRERLELVRDLSRTSLAAIESEARHKSTRVA